MLDDILYVFNIAFCHGWDGNMEEMVGWFWCISHSSEQFHVFHFHLYFLFQPLSFKFAHSTLEGEAHEIHTGKFLLFMLLLLLEWWVLLLLLLWQRTLLCSVWASEDAMTTSRATATQGERGDVWDVYNDGGCMNVLHECGVVVEGSKKRDIRHVVCDHFQLFCVLVHLLLVCVVDPHSIDKTHNR